jgi:hypothetical protein
MNTGRLEPILVLGSSRFRLENSQCLIIAGRKKEAKNDEKSK